MPQQDWVPPTSDRFDPKVFQTARKRKRANAVNGGPIGESFTIQAHPSLPSPTTQQLAPKLLLPRSCLPLTCLDQIHDAEDQPSPRLFLAHIECLEKDGLEDRLIRPMVLIAQSLVDQSLHVVESVRPGVYALCRLGTWVTLKSLARLQTMMLDSDLLQDIPKQERSASLDDDWWRIAAIGSVCVSQEGRRNPTSAEEIKRNRLCLQRPTHDSIPRSPISMGTTIPALVNTEVRLETMVDEVSPSPDEILQMIKAQYQEALYAFKTPLAYFAKGPLSRARAIFQHHDASAYDQLVLVQFLRSSILSLATMDVKYRETLPSLVKNLPFETLSDDECMLPITATTKKARKSKKTKIDKNGLYAGEEISVTRWWLGRDKSSMACDSPDSREDAIKAILLEQRARETQLQIILILETLALERSVTTSDANPHNVKDLPEATGETQVKHKKPRKPQDLDTLLEMLVDRLSIWQSMSMDEGKASDTNSKPSLQPRNNPTTTSIEVDTLRQFCVEVVLPFFGARLSDLTTTLCQKLGGPQQSPPKRPPLAKAATSALLKSHAVPQRQQPRKPRRTLERVLTAERSASHRRPPALSRSATDSVLPRLKREETDTSLSSIPLNKVALHKRYIQREVDFHAASQATEVKLKNKAKVEQELQSAIAALKKPNPRMAVKELVEDAEKRVAGSRSRKSKNPVRNPFAQGVQVMATPSKKRHNDIFGKSPRLPRPCIVGPAEPEVDDIPPSSAFRITDSTSKARRASDLAMDHSHQQLPTVEQTPIRGSSKLLGRPTSMSSTTLTAHKDLGSPNTSTARLVPSSVTSRIPSIQHLPSWPRTVHETPSKSRVIHLVEQGGRTPGKVTSETANVSSVTSSFSSSQEQGTSIYASLGWDDIDDLA